MFTIDVTKGEGKSAKSYRKVFIFPTGYSAYPEAGGALDQPVRLMTIFDIFFQAERSVAFKNLKA